MARFPLLGLDAWSGNNPEGVQQAGQTDDDPERAPAACDPHHQVGVRKIRAINAILGTTDRVYIYAFFSLLAWSLSLDQYTNSAYLAQATATSFNAHSLLAAINTIKAVSQAVSQPPIAKISDLWGRVETYALCVALYAIGYVIVATAPSIYVYALGVAINILGITGLYLLQEIVIGDISSLKNRLFWSIFPSLPGAVNVWIGGNLTDSMLSHSTWRWGIGMFAIMTPALSIPIIFSLATAQRRAHKKKMLHVIKPSNSHSKSKASQASDWLSQLDALGLLLLTVGFGCILVTITIANAYGSSWKDAHCIVLFIVGGLNVIGFFLWEARYAKNPLLPFFLLKNRTVIVGMLLAIAHPMAGSIANDYFYTFLVVAANQSVLSATRISGLAIFISIPSCLLAGVVASWTKRLKAIIVFGGICDAVGLGLMIRYRNSQNSLFELVLPQIFRGLSEGLVGFPVQAAIQAESPHQHLASITAIYLMIFYLSGGIGAAIGGGIWVNTLPDKIHEYIPNNFTLAQDAYEDPFTFSKNYNISTSERQAVARAQSETQRLILIVATSVGVLSVIISLFIKDKELTKHQTRPELEPIPLDKSQLTSSQQHRNLFNDEEYK